MVAAVLVDNASVQLTEVPCQPPAADECLVRIEAAGICSSDIARSSDRGAYFYPLIMGHELAGTVVMRGAETPDDLTPGTAVTVFPLLPCFACDACANERYAQCRSYDYYGSRRHGGFAQYLTVKAWNLLPLPDGVGTDDGALAEPVSVVVHALDRLGLVGASQAGTGPLLILGAGFLGLLAVKILRLCAPDIAVTIIDRNAGKLAIAAADGARAIHLADPRDWDAFAQSHRASFPMVLEAAGVPDTFRHALDLCRHGGQVVWMGNISGDLTLPQSLVSQVLRREITISGTWNSTWRGRELSDWTVALDMMRQGLAPSRLVDKFVGLDGIGDLLANLAAHKRRQMSYPVLKAVARPNA
jgi:L-iditol 2-dehydrogenase